MDLKNLIGKALSDIADKTSANCILLLNKSHYKSSENVRIKATLIRKSKNGNLNKGTFDFVLSNLPPESVSQIKKIIIDIMNKDGLKKGDNVFCVTDKSFGSGFNGLFFLLEIDDSFTSLSTVNLDKEVNKAVLDTVLDISREIAKEGREGRKVGTAFLIGDHEKVLESSSQMILNPFEGHPLPDRNILDPMLRETVKNFAMLDGVFILDDKGFIHAAGRYLDVDSKIVSLPGYGARHTSVAGMSRITDCVGVVLSESGGKIKVFKKGNIIKEE